jgi:hypothetical protein
MTIDSQDPIEVNGDDIEKLVVGIGGRPYAVSTEGGLYYPEDECMPYDDLPDFDLTEDPEDEPSSSLNIEYNGRYFVF